jgi:hypothetical protein
MRGAECVRVVLERGSTLTVELGGQAVTVRVRDLAADGNGEIRAELEHAGG